MASRSPNEIIRNRARFSGTNSEDQLIAAVTAEFGKATVAELRKFASLVGVEGYAKLKREALISSILEITRFELVVSEPAELHSADNERSDVAYNAIATLLFAELQTICVEKDPNTYGFKFSNLVSHCRNQVIKSIRTRGTDAPAPSTIVTGVNAVVKKVLYLAETDPTPYPEGMWNVRNMGERFRAAVRAASGDDRGIKYTQTVANLNARRNQKVEIFCKDLVDWAVEKLKNLPTKKTGWTEVACAIAILTGRRQSEIMCSGRFEPISESELRFTGQLKRHNPNKPDTGYVIPVLRNSAYLVGNAIEWLNYYDKRIDPDSEELIAKFPDGFIRQQEAATASKNRFSKLLSQTTKLVFKRVQTNLAKADMELFEAKQQFKTFRQIYAQIALETVKSVGGVKADDLVIIARFLGHDTDPARLNTSAINYDSDVIVLDAKDCV